jgi:hypothetical protein
VRGDLLNNAGIPIIGLGQRQAEFERLPLQWMPPIRVADVADSVRRVEGDGGRVLTVSQWENARFAVVQGPVGAYFGPMQSYFGLHAELSPTASSCI